VKEKKVIFSHNKKKGRKEKNFFFGGNKRGTTKTRASECKFNDKFSENKHSVVREKIGKRKK
jgi:hypothetical protein